MDCLPYSKMVCGGIVGGRGKEGSQSSTGWKKLLAGGK